MITEAKVRMHEAGEISFFQHLRWVEFTSNKDDWELPLCQGVFNLRTGLPSTYLALQSERDSTFLALF